MSQRAAIYSKSDGSQSVESQRPEVEQLARARGFEVAHAYEEQASATKHRPQYEQMLTDAQRGKFQVLVVRALDRFGRSMVGNLQDVLELDRPGVQVVSVRESWLDTGSPVRTLLIAIFSWVAEQERARLVERTKAGLESARRRGPKSGGPGDGSMSSGRASYGPRDGRPGQVAAELGVGAATLHRALANRAALVAAGE